MKKTNIRRGDIFWVDFDPSKATEIKKIRPSLICSPDVMNENSTRVIVAPITSNLNKIYGFEYEIKLQSKIKGKVMFDQLRSIDKVRLGKKISELSIVEMKEVEELIKLVMGINS